MSAHGITTQEPQTALGTAPSRATRPQRMSAWTASALRAVVYAGAVFVWSIVAFTVLVTGLSVTVSLLVLIIGVFVWVGFAYVVRWTTWVDRRTAGSPDGSAASPCGRSIAVRTLAGSSRS